MSSSQRLLDLTALAKLHRLDVVARAVVDGMQSGIHRSPHKGQSVDFADHRPYVAGDDLRHLDWKVLGRSDRLVLKRYEAETDMACHMIVDGSGSMSYQGERSPFSKFGYVSVLAATLAHLVLKQQDRVALQLFSEGPLQHLAPAQSSGFEHFCHVLQDHACIDGTDAVKGVQHIAAPATRRGLVVLFSDCLGDVDEWELALDRLCLRGHDVVVLWCLDPDEVDLGIDVVTRFLGLEEGGELLCEPRAVRAAYQQEVAAHRLALLEICRSRRVTLLEVRTDEAPEQALNQILVALQQRH